MARIIDRNRAMAQALDRSHAAVAFFGEARL
jgi:hypothetical protein